MSPFLSAVQAMIDLCTTYHSQQKHRALYVRYNIFRVAATLAQEWPRICKVLPPRDFSDTEIPMGINSSVTLCANGTVLYNYKRNWVDMPSEVAAALKASAQLDRACLDILDAAGISVPEPIVDTPAPTTVQKVFSLADAMVQWAKSGFKIAPEEQYKDRKAICLACDQWDGEGYFGAGACKSCGCSGAKLYLASSKCPKEKW